MFPNVVVLCDLDLDHLDSDATWQDPSGKISNVLLLAGTYMQS